MTGLSPLIEIRNLTRIYNIGRTALHALKNVSLTIEPGEYVAVVGTSGSGKSTLLNILGLLDRPTEGTYRIHNQDAGELTDKQRTTLRNQEIGFVFQEFNLLARATAQRQAELPLFYAGVSPKESRRRALDALAQVGLADRANHRPEELSGGQRQRVAIARALVNRPSLLLADEPTGAIDTQTGEEVMTLFEQRHLEGLTLVVVTHDREIASRARRIITLRDGAVISDERRPAPVAP
ncbi:MAG: ABC transporter ATP-binding protein [Caldilineaceae bacterium]|nr:ABC transporter ATP-binding protein [Caldilineaceae bacterium]